MQAGQTGQAEQPKRPRDWKTLAARIFVIVAAIAGGYLVLRLSLTVFLPFLLAAGLAALIRPAAAGLAKRLHLPTKLCGAVLTILVLALIVFLLALAVDRVTYEAQRLFSFLGVRSEEIGEKIAGMLDEWGRFADRFFPVKETEQGTSPPSLREPMGEALSTLINEAVSRVGGFLSGIVAKGVAALPSLLLSGLVLILSCFYFVLDDGRVKGFLCGLLPRTVRDELPRLRGRAVRLAGRYARAYLLLMSVTFVEVFVGLLLLRVEYAFLPALIVAAVDVMPVLGAGTVLIPWGVILLIGGNFYRGIGILILYGVVVLCREVLEPRVVGDSLGLHPLAMLAATYVGVRVFGAIGFLAGPVVALAVRVFLERRDGEGEPADRTT